MILLSVVCLALILLLLVTGGGGRAGARIHRLGFAANGPREGRSNSGPLPGSRRSPVAESGDRLLARIVQAGLYGRGALAIYTIVRVTLMVLPVALGLLAARTGLVTFTMGLLYGFLAGVIGTVAPSFWLDHLKAKRQSVMRRALPDAMDVVVVCVEAGLSVSSALARVSKELQLAHPMLSAELTICQREIQMGATTGEALRGVAYLFYL
jgi:tight adherence protein C